MIRKLLAANRPVGTFFDLDGPLAMECIALSGIDFVILDFEHSPLMTENAVELICRAQLHKLPVIARTHGLSRSAVMKPLDAGADAVMVPYVQSLAQAKQAVQFAKYPPAGERGVSLTRAAGYGLGAGFTGLTDLFAEKNKHTGVILQCETTGCLDAIEDIAALDGVDGIFIGPFDLTTSMGIPGEFQSPRFLQAVRRVLAACAAAGKDACIFTPDAKAAAAYFAQGFQSVTIGTAASLLGRACAAVKQLLEDTPC